MSQTALSGLELILEAKRERAKLETTLERIAVQTERIREMRRGEPGWITGVGPATDPDAREPDMDTNDLQGDGTGVHF